MYIRSILLAATVQLLSGICLAQSAQHLNLTAIALVNNASVIQCWQLNQTITTVQFPQGPGIISDLGPLGNPAIGLGDPVNATWESVPAGSTFPGQHAAAAVEYNIVLSGSLLLNISETGQSATIQGGAHGLILVTDIAGTGHSAAIGPESPAVVMMMPIKDNVVPAHTVLHDGQCAECEMHF
ncbi:hypothetical protein MMC10_005124 [Thelotrema lepadinum]|nr:hypothetical protein [Thelotrema lepadinum]